MERVLDNLSTIYTFKPSGVVQMVPKISVVIPVSNQVKHIPQLHAELKPVLEGMYMPYEVVAVDDGSTDGSFDALRKLHEADPRWRVLRFRRPFGQTTALIAGFDAARGQYIVTIDAALEHDPRDIPRLVRKAETGCDVVSGWRIQRDTPLVERVPKLLANLLLVRSADKAIHDYDCALKVYRSDIAKSVRLHGELHDFIPAIAHRLGATLAEMPVSDRARRPQNSWNSLAQTFSVLLDLISYIIFQGFSTRPLHLFGGAGLIAGAFGALIGMYLAFAKITIGQPIGGNPLLIVALLLIVLGVQLTGAGFVAELVTRGYREPEGRRLYTVRETLDGRKDARA